MNKKALKEIKLKLEKEKNLLEKQLQSFAEKDKKLKGDWDTRYPSFNGGAGSQKLEEAADEVEEYANLLPIEYSLELKLRNVNLALEKINLSTGPRVKYGKCEKCGKEISKERLKICPEAKFCLKCKDR